LKLFEKAKEVGLSKWLETNVIDYINEDLIEQLYIANKTIKEAGKNPWPYLLIFDDVLCD